MKKNYDIYLIYSLIFLVSVLSFWLGFGQDAFGYGILIIWLLNPIAILISGILLGKRRSFRSFEYLYPIYFGILYMMLSYFTFSLANNIAFDKINMPDFSLVFFGTMIAYLGYFIGHGYQILTKKQFSK